MGKGAGSSAAPGGGGGMDHTAFLPIVLVTEARHLVLEGSQPRGDRKKWVRQRWRGEAWHIGEQRGKGTEACGMLT